MEYNIYVVKWNSKVTYNGNPSKVQIPQTLIDLSAVPDLFQCNVGVGHVTWQFFNVNMNVCHASAIMLVYII